MKTEGGLVDQRIWNASALVLGVLALGITILTGFSGGWSIAQHWPAIAALTLLHTAIVFLSTSLLSGVETSVSNLVLVTALLAFGSYPAMLIGWLGALFTEIARTLFIEKPYLGRYRSPHQILVSIAYGGSSVVVGASLGSLIYRALGGTLAPFSLSQNNLLPLIGLLLTEFTLTVLLLAWRLFSITPQPIPFLVRHWIPVIICGLLAQFPAILTAQEYSELRLYESVVLILIMTLVAAALRIAHQTRATLGRRVQQLRALGDISHRLSASLELDTVLDAIRHETTRLLDAQEFYLALYDEQSSILDFPLVVRYGERVAPHRRQMGTGLTEYVIRTRRTLLLSNNLGEQIQQMGVTIYGKIPLSFLAVPILVGEQILGVVAVQNYQRAGAYSEADASLLETIASQAGTALQNAQLYRRIRRQAEQLASLNKATTLIGASLDPDEVVDRICELALEVMGAQKVAVFMLTEGGQRIKIVRHIGLSEQYVTEAQDIPIGDKTGRTKVITQNKPIVIPDIGADTAFDDTLLPIAEHEGFRALIEVPLRVGQRIIGELTVYYTEPRVFEPDEIELLSTLGGQVAIAIENARRFERTDVELDRRIQELETIEAVSREMTSHLDLRLVMKQVIQAAAQATGAEFAEIAELDEQRQVLHSVAKLEDIELAFNGWPFDRGVTGRALRLGKPIRVQDVSKDPDYSAAYPDIRSELVVPIVHGNRPLGVINLESTRLDAFTADHERFVAMLAKHAAIAIENARLFQATQRQLQELALLRAAAIELLLSPDVKHALQIIAQHALRLTEAQDVHIYLYDDETGVLTFGTSRWNTGEQDIEFACPRPNGLTARVARSGQFIVVEDMSTHPLFVSVAEKTGDPRWGAGSIVSIPLKRGDRVIGVFNVALPYPHEFTDHELRALELLAAQAAVALDHARLMEEIRDARDRLQAILDSTHDGILLFDSRHRLLLANPRAEYLLNLRAEDHIGHGFLQIVEHLLRPRDVEGTGYSMEDALALVEEIEANPHHITRRRYTPIHPSPRAIEEITTPVVGQTGEPLGRLFVLRDVSQEIEMEQYREEVTSMIVHDLRSPLGSIITGLHFALGELQDAHPDVEAIEASLNIAFTSAQSQLRLIETLLDINKLASGEVPLSLSSVNLAAVAQETMNALGNVARGANISLSLSTPSDLPDLTADEETIRRLFTNLLDNALNFTPSDGQIQVTIESFGTHQLVTVTDTGPGVPAEDRVRIFERFVQLRGRPRLRGSKGTGLGLTFCKLAVEAHGGRIWVDTGEQGGASFHFTLPTDLQSMSQSARRPTE